MCLITMQQKPFKASCDMVTYKLLRSDGMAVFMRFSYELMRLYREDISISYCMSPFDSYDIRALEEEYGLGYEFKADMNSYGTGFHSYLDPDRGDGLSMIHENKAVFECIIPKRSLYYENVSGLIISNQIIIIKPIKVYEIGEGGISGWTDISESQPAGQFYRRDYNPTY